MKTFVLLKILRALSVFVVRAFNNKPRRHEGHKEEELEIMIKST